VGWETAGVLTGPRRLVALVVGATVLVVVGVVAFLLLPPRQSDDVAVPAGDATPEQVVTAYLAAVVAHDCDTAEAVTTRDAEDGAESWCDDVGRLTDVDVRDHVTERPEDSGHSAPTEIVDVPVSFDVHWRLFHDDGSMEDGATTWGYLLVRESPHSRWRIFDQGTG